MNTISTEFNHEAERTRQHELLLWLIFFIILDDESRKRKLTRKKYYQRPFAPKLGR